MSLLVSLAEQYASPGSLRTRASDVVQRPSRVDARPYDRRASCGPLTLAVVVAMIALGTAALISQLLGPHYELRGRVTETDMFVHSAGSSRSGKLLMPSVGAMRLTPADAIRAWLDPERDVTTTPRRGASARSGAMERSITDAVAAARAYLGDATAPTIDRPPMEGPSGGLMFALTIVDVGRDCGLRAGRTIAGTGTILSDGTVGPVGEVAIKAAAAERAGADVFLVPLIQVEQAATATTTTRVVGVRTLGDAVASLEATS